MENNVTNLYQEEKTYVAAELSNARHLLGDNLFTDWLPDLDLEQSLFAYKYYLRISARIKPREQEAAPPYCHNPSTNIDTKRTVEVDSAVLVRQFDRLLKPHIIRYRGGRARYLIEKYSQPQYYAVYIIGSTQELPVAHAFNDAFLLMSHKKWSFAKGFYSSCQPFTILAKNKRAQTLLQSTECLNSSCLSTLAEVSKPSISVLWHMRNRKRWAHLISKLKSLPPLDQSAAAKLLEDLLYMLSVTYLIEGMRKRLAPRFVIGAFEKSAYCSLLNAVLNRPGMQQCHIINMQHGIVGDDALLECLNVSAFFLWDEASRQSIIQRGDISPERLDVVGRICMIPNLVNDQSFIFSWKKNSIMLLACLQPLSRHRQKAFVLPLINYLYFDPTARLFIRLHPTQSDHEKALWLMAVPAELHDRILVAAAPEFTLSECIEAADLVCSDYSTVLVDALYNGRLPLSIYTESKLDNSVHAYFNALNIKTLHCHEATPYAIRETLVEQPRSSKDGLTFFSEEFLQSALSRIGKSSNV